ncbi:MAG TPA: hypothetical protein VJR23_01800 [Candidatus Acidoferrales bacterium]|nr:hypothetical protein [Candidatus Acidoferrales bacterium]
MSRLSTGYLAKDGWFVQLQRFWAARVDALEHYLNRIYPPQSAKRNPRSRR